MYIETYVCFINKLPLIIDGFSLSAINDSVAVLG